METLFIYSLKSAGCLTLFWLLYRALLSRETFHRINRLTLLTIAVLSVAIPPLADRLILPQTALTGLVSQAVLPEVIVADTASPSVVATATAAPLLSFSWTTLLLPLYLMGMAGCLLLSAWQLVGIVRRIAKGERRQIDGMHVSVHADSRQVPFSWMNRIVISQTDLDEAGSTILTHEQAHVRYRHTSDLLLTRGLLIFQWYNPAAWLLYAELQAVHEFEADEFVLNQGIDATQYQLLLIRKAVGQKRYTMAHSIGNCKLKKRIIKMLQKKSSAWARLKYATILPLAAIVLLACARTEKTETPAEVPVTEAAETNTSANHSAIDTTTFMVAEQMPEFQGGAKALMEYLDKTVRYPESAKKEHIEGRVMVAFVVDRNGSIRDAEVIRGIHPALDAEALRAVNAMPKWIPGTQRGQAVNVKYTLPIAFRMGNKGKSK